MPRLRGQASLAPFRAFTRKHRAIATTGLAEPEKTGRLTIRIFVIMVYIVTMRGLGGVRFASGRASSVWVLRTITVAADDGWARGAAHPGEEAGV